MSENLSAEDDAQLSRWAFGRAITPAEKVRAERAGAELQRRAVAERERRDIAVEHDVAEARPLSAVLCLGGEIRDEDAGSSWTDEELHPRRRMRVTGIVGVVSAVIALGAIVQVQSQPDPDPLAIFDRPATQLDQEWSERFALDPALTVTAGPKVIAVRDTLEVIAARVSTVPDGRSTSYDAYCLYLGADVEGGGWSLSGDCTYPARFEVDGLSSTISAAMDGDGFDNVVWGPIGAPRVERNVPNAVATENSNLLEWLMQPNYIALARPNPLENVGEPERLLAGPKLANDTREIAGENLTVEVFLLAGANDNSEPDMCIHVDHPAADPATSCRDLSTAERNGLGIIVQIAGEQWIVSITDNGGVVADRAATPVVEPRD